MTVPLSDVRREIQRKHIDQIRGWLRSRLEEEQLHPLKSLDRLSYIDAAAIWEAIYDYEGNEDAPQIRRAG